VVDFNYYSYHGVGFLRTEDLDEELKISSNGKESRGRRSHEYFTKGREAT
jgi:hypothetical protein